ncbi:MAG: Acyl carrier protein [bacterium ADurb.BinA186]|nr:MAG: Acyl carrier protein [bacterium ADurb.BinA186]
MFHEVQKEVMRILRIPMSMVTPDATIYGDLQADSLDFQELVYSLEQKFDIEISEEEVARLEYGGTVGDFASLVERLQSAQVPA